MEPLPLEGRAAKARPLGHLPGWGDGGREFGVRGGVAGPDESGRSPSGRWFAQGPATLWAATGHQGPTFTSSFCKARLC